VANENGQQKVEAMVRSVERDMAAQADAASGAEALRREQADSVMPQPEGGAAWRRWIGRRSERAAEERGQQ
jgi:hypothetical protein